MHIPIIILPLLIFLSLNNANADSVSDATKALQAIVKEKFTVINYDIGDLNNDGLEDWVGIITFEKLSGTTQRLCVLTRDVSNGLVLAEATRETTYTDCGGSCGSEVMVSNGSFYVTQFSRWGGGSSSAKTQFKLYKNIWRAIGYTAFDMDLNNGSDFTRDTNLLTGAYKTVANSVDASGKPNKPKNTSGTGKSVMELLKDLDLSQH